MNLFMLKMYENWKNIRFYGDISGFLGIFAACYLTALR